MRQRGKLCISDLASTALCMNSGLRKGGLSAVLLRKRCHCGSRQKLNFIFMVHIGDSLHHWSFAHTLSGRRGCPPRLVAIPAF